MKESLEVVAVGAHPDDIEGSVLGTLKLLKDKGHNIHFVTMTAGSMGCPERFGEDIETTRYFEAKASSEKLGATYDCLGQRDTEISDSPESIREIVRMLRRYEADIVFTHPRDDYMLDHEKTHTAVGAATNYTVIPRYCRFEVESAKMHDALQSIPHLYYWSPSGCVDLYGEVFPAHFLVTLSQEEVKAKKEGFAMHASQIEWLKRHFGIDQQLKRLETSASLWIPHFNLEEKTTHKYAEAFTQDLSCGFPRTDILKEILGNRLLPTKNYKLQTQTKLESANRFLELNKMLKGTKQAHC